VSGTTFGIIKALQQKPRNHTTPPSQGGRQLLDARIHYPVHKHPTATQTPSPPPTPHPQALRQGNPPQEAGDREAGQVWRAVPAPSQENKHPARSGTRQKRDPPYGGHPATETGQPHPPQRGVWGRACSLRTQQRADHPQPAPASRRAMRRCRTTRKSGDCL